MVRDPASDRGYCTVKHIQHVENWEIRGGCREAGERSGEGPRWKRPHSVCITLCPAATMPLHILVLLVLLLIMMTTMMVQAHLGSDALWRCAAEQQVCQAGDTLGVRRGHRGVGGRRGGVKSSLFTLLRGWGFALLNSRFVDLPPPHPPKKPSPLPLSMCFASPHLHKLWPQQLGVRLVKPHQQLLVSGGAHQGETVAVWEQPLDAGTDLGSEVQGMKREVGQGRVGGDRVG